MVRLLALGSLVLAVCALGLSGCDSRMDEVDLETQQAQFLLATLPTDVQGRCVAAVAQAMSCATAAGNISIKVAGATIPSIAASSFYVSYHETVYGLTVAAPKGGTELCTALVAARNYPVPLLTNSNGAKVCVHDCEKAAWIRHSNAGLCTAAGFMQLTGTSGAASVQTTTLALSNDHQYAGCVSTCLGTGTIFPQ